MIRIAYDDRLLRWKLGKTHPSSPERAKNAIHMLESMGADIQVSRISGVATVQDLTLVHSPEYVMATIRGYNDEWQGCQPKLGKVARLMFQGTVDMVWRMERDGPGIYFSPQGAKHHAGYARGSGFCVFNDMAWAATYLSRQGHRVLYLDTDAHHGDGVENLTYGNTDVMTASIHDSSIFPGTGNWDTPNLRVFNWPLEAGAGDDELCESVAHALELAADFDPTVILVALGGDGYADDPLSTLQYSYTGYGRIARSIAAFARERSAPIIVGGAGGYLPKTHTPAVWASFVSELEYAYTSRHVYTGAAL